MNATEVACINGLTDAQESRIFTDDEISGAAESTIAYRSLVTLRAADLVECMDDSLDDITSALEIVLDRKIDEFFAE